MTKEEFFILSIKQLSGRSSQIIRELKITQDNISDFSYSDFVRLPNCGDKTAKELLNLAEQINNRYPSSSCGEENNSITNRPVKIFDELQKSFGLSCRACNALRWLEICDFASLDKEANNNFLLLRSARNVGMKTIAEIQNFYKQIKKIVPKTEELYNYFTPEYQAYKERKSDYLDGVLAKIYHTIFLRLNYKKRGVVSTYFSTFVDVLFTDINTLHVTAPTINKRNIILDTLLSFKEDFLGDAKPYLEMPINEFWWQEYFANKLFLSEDDKCFIRQFTEQENHFPYWYIIYKALTFRPANVRKWSAAEIFSSYIGLTGERKSYLDLSLECSLTSERIRQILSNFNASKFIEELSFDKTKVVETYSFLQEDFLTVENTDFQKLSIQEHLPFAFQAFGHICSLINNHLVPISFYTNNKGILLAGDGRSKCIYTTAYNNQLSNFNILLTMQKLQMALINKSKSKSSIVISDFCRDALFWYGCVDLDILPRVARFVEHLAVELLEVRIVDGVIYNEAPKNDLEQTLYECLSESEIPLSPDDLFEAYCRKCPNTHIADSKEIRLTLTRSPKFVAIGGKSLYMLAERENQSSFKGSLYDSIESVLSQSSSPVTRESLVKGTLELRPDSNCKSIRAIIASMLKSKRLLIFNDKYIGLPGVKYNQHFKCQQYEARQSFEEHLKNMKKFVVENNRLPFMQGEPRESSLALWYSRTAKNMNLTTQQMVEYYNFQQDIIATQIPQTIEQFSFQQNCITYKAYIQRTGILVSTTYDKKLYDWFKRVCYHYSKIKDVRKVYFDDLIRCISSFGYEVLLR